MPSSNLPKTIWGLRSILLTSKQIDPDYAEKLGHYFLYSPTAKILEGPNACDYHLNELYAKECMEIISNEMDVESYQRLLQLIEHATYSERRRYSLIASREAESCSESIVA